MKIKRIFVIFEEQKLYKWNDRQMNLPRSKNGKKKKNKNKNK